MTWLFFHEIALCTQRASRFFLPKKTLFLHHLCSLLRALNKKSSAYKPSPRHLLSGDTKGSASAYTIWAYFGNNQRVSSSEFQRSPIIIVVDFLTSLPLKRTLILAESLTSDPYNRGFFKKRKSVYGLSYS